MLHLAFNQFPDPKICIFVVHFFCLFTKIFFFFWWHGTPRQAPLDPTLGTKPRITQPLLPESISFHKDYLIMIIKLFGYDKNFVAWSFFYQRQVQVYLAVNLIPTSIKFFSELKWKSVVENLWPFSQLPITFFFLGCCRIWSDHLHQWRIWTWVKLSLALLTRSNEDQLLASGFWTYRESHFVVVHEVGLANFLSW